MKLVQMKSPNHGPRPVGVEIDCVALHADASTNAKASADWCCVPAPKNPNPVAYHTIVERDGRVYHLVDPMRRAWHAGKSSFMGRDDVNDFAIGLCFSNRNDGKERYTDDQYTVGAALVAGWMKRFPKITLERITTHAIISPGRKTDPLGFDVVRFKTLVAAELARLSLPPAA